LEGLLHRGFLVGECLRVFGLYHPPRQDIRNRMDRGAGGRLDGDGDRRDASQFRRNDVDGIDIVALIVVFLVRDFVHRVPARGDAVHLRLGIKLCHRQVAGLRRAAGTDANELPDGDQSAAQDGDRQDHLQKG